MLTTIVTNPLFAITGWLFGAISLFLALKRGGENKALKEENQGLKNSQNQYTQTVSGNVGDKSNVINQARDVKIENN